MADAPLIRPTVRAVIRQGDRVLVQIKRAASGRRYLTLPGGGQAPGETAQEALARECAEEIGAVPRIGALLHAADLFRQEPGGRIRQRAELLFACTLPEGYVPQVGPHPDKRQIGTAWAALAAEGPSFLPRYDLALTDPDAPLHLGRIAHEAP